MRKVLCIAVVLTLVVGVMPALAVIPGAAPGPAAAVPMAPVGWAVTIDVANNGAGGVPTVVTSPVWVVVPGIAVGGSQAFVRATAIAAAVNAAATPPNLLADMANVGAIDYNYVGNGVNDYVISVLGPNMWGVGTGLQKNKLLTVDSSLANFYGVSRRTLAHYLTCRLRGMAEMDSMGNGWGDVSTPNMNALKTPWNNVDP